MTANAIILADSFNAATRTRLTTFLLPRFPKILWQQFLTHRILGKEGAYDFSKNTASSRAIPVKKVIEGIRQDPYIPDWRAKQKGMGGMDTLTQEQKDKATAKWLYQMEESIRTAEALHNDLGVSKQDANRCLEPWMRIPCIVSATEWDNFFFLRTQLDPIVQADVRAAAMEMQALMQSSEPRILQPGDWHIPFVDFHVSGDLPLSHKLMMSAARCARGSYANHFGGFSLDEDLRLCRELDNDKHDSPLEHQAQAEGTVHPGQANYKGFLQFRHHPLREEIQRV